MKRSFFFFQLIMFALFSSKSLAQFTNYRITQNDSDQSETAIAVSPSNLNHLISAWHDYKIVTLHDKTPG